MKLLIVDDEKLTRDGLLSSIDWNKLNIDEIFVAENGIQGLSIAKTNRPEIILSDVRMPKMDGIKMAEELQSILPNSSVIFMSGYSDKEYLKAAIKLKAVSYIEKPLDPKEIEEALQSAIEELQMIAITQSSVALHTLNKAAQLALRLTYPLGSNEQQLESLFDSLSFTAYKSCYITTFILKFDDLLPNESDRLILDNALEQTSDFINHLKINQIHVIKHETHIIFYLFQQKPCTTSTLNFIGQHFQNTYRKCGNYFVIMGKTVQGYQHAFDSYSSAVILAQRTFFADYFSFITEEFASLTQIPSGQNLTSEFISALSNTNKEDTFEIADAIFTTMKSSSNLSPSQVKDIYYKLFMGIQSSYKKFQLNLTTIGSDEDSIMSYVEPCTTLITLHSYLIEKIHNFYSDLDNYQPENPIIFSIKEYISLNYTNELLSVKDIGNHVNLSTSYVCTIFKSETGQTLNQYITDFRIQKAKDLLSDPRYKITDISSKVGYADGNYFGKSFKKTVGLSPSEFRERMML